ncbi:MAG: ATP-dependent Clp protease adaptor ClpS [Ignavibacteria bacterium]|nr:ATP-dependent Clp protease adaptor ClpS [Ignavibacteria bacterium]MCC7158567.1 ATP-dependent Clp protease adaptor ClpS [Ignavibacteria bacterium]
MTGTEEILAPEAIDIDSASHGFTLILYNDSHHDFDEVINQVMLATGCGYDKAESITMEVHNKGRAAVLAGELDKCLRAQSVLEEIALRTSIEVNA